MKRIKLTELNPRSGSALGSKSDGGQSARPDAHLVSGGFIETA
jgi:hypothetical protein